MATRVRPQLSAQMKDAAEEAIRNLELSVRFIVTDYTVEFVADTRSVQRNTTSPNTSVR